MCRKVKAVIILSIFIMLCFCQSVYIRALKGIMVLAAEGEAETEYKEIQGYVLQYNEPDGKNGFYRKMPTVMIRHQDEGLITKYQLTRPGGENKEGELTIENPDVELGSDEEDGTYNLRIWLERVEPIPPEIENPGEPEDPEETEKPGQTEMPEETENTGQDDSSQEETDYSEEELKAWEKEVVWVVDGTPPQVNVASPVKGVWYKEDVTVSAKATDIGSGMADIKGSCAEENYQGSSGQIQFKTNIESVANRPVDIKITAEDRAGNITQVKLPVYIDKKSPALYVDGAENYMITGKDVTLSFKIKEENTCDTYQLAYIQELPGGESRENSITDWEKKENNLQTSIHLVDDGIYKFTLKASDAAGNYSEDYKQITVDKTNPVIRYMDLFQGKWMREFCWNYNILELVDDFTTYTYQVEMDGRLYSPGERILREGKHILKLVACDAAGNKSYNNVVFTIDRTAPILHYEKQEKKENIADGAVFEKQIDMQIYTEHKNDTITAVKINGEKQNIPSRGNVFRCSLKEPKPYEIIAEAVDKAGNTTKTEIGIHLNAEKTFIEKAVEPVKKVFLKQENKKHKGVERDNEEKVGSVLVIVGVVAILSGIGIGLWRIMQHKKEKGNDEEKNSL